MKCLSLRKLLNNVFKRKIKQILFENLASEDCYIDLPVIVQKVKLWSLQLFVIIVVNYQITCNTVSSSYQWSIVIVVNFSLLSPLVAFICIQLYLVTQVVKPGFRFRLFFFFSSFIHKSPSGLYSARVTDACVRHMEFTDVLVVKSYKRTHRSRQTNTKGR